MNRRTFLKIAGASTLSIAAGCSSEPEKTLFSLVQAPDDMVTGKAVWYASTCRECPAGCGILAKNREGRVIKVEGNLLHPINRGRLCMRGQAALQGAYNPDRIKRPLLKEKTGWRTLSFTQAEALLKDRITGAAEQGQNRVRILTEVVGKGLMQLFRETLEGWNSGAPLVFEPYAYESLKTANQRTFGLDGLLSYRMEEADFLLSFGADFLETWLSPVEYARKFKEMHSPQDGRKGVFFHVSPHQSLTGTNADLWLCCTPDGEAAVALGIIREAIHSGRGSVLQTNIRASIEKVASPYTKEKVLQLSGISQERYEKLLTRIFKARKPLILGTGSADSGINALQANMAANLLNLTLDPDLTLFDFENRHRVEVAARRSEVLEFFKALEKESVDLLLLNNVNPLFTLPPGSGAKEALKKDSLFIVSFSNFMDETTKRADLIFPTALSLETWDEYGGMQSISSTLQPVMGSLTGAPALGDLFLRLVSVDKRPANDFRTYLYDRLLKDGSIKNEKGWLEALQRGGVFEPLPREEPSSWQVPDTFASDFTSMPGPLKADPVFIAVPSIRFFDGRGANRPWLCEVPDPLTQVAWQTPVLMHPETLSRQSLKEGDIIRIQSKQGTLEAPIFETMGVRPGVLVMSAGQGHESYGRYAKGMGLNPLLLLSPEPEPVSGAPMHIVGPVSIQKTGRSIKLARTDGSRIQHGRKIALTVDQKELEDRSTDGKPHGDAGLSMYEFPLTLPLPEGYDRKRDIYPPHEHEDYRWAMVIDLDRCIGCGACAAACYAENNIGVVGLERMLEGREMSWIRVERYHDPKQMEKVTFLPMLCQHCDNAPCEAVCPVYAPHHSKEGLNNQIYNRCIGTRFCSQNCPYKVRRFNWFTWKWPDPLNLQLNPNVTVRSKGVMEKCSFCVQRIKEAHGIAKNENRKIRDEEIQPACLQTCPTGAFIFGNLMDRESRVRKLVQDRRAYQVIGYLNTKPAVFYLKKVIRET